MAINNNNSFNNNNKCTFIWIKLFSTYLGTSVKVMLDLHYYLSLTVDDIHFLRTSIGLKPTSNSAWEHDKIFK